MNIDKELRMAGRMMQLVFRPNVFSFKMFNRVMRLSRDRAMQGYDNSTVQIARSDGNGHVRTRIYKPLQRDQPLPIVLHLHGGGYAIGAPEQDHAIFDALMTTRPCVIVAPDYRLSIDDPYPAGLNDCYDALRWVLENADELGGRTDQIIVMGESAGGGLTAAITLRARDSGDVNIAFQMPLYPMIDDRQTNPSAIGNTAPAWSSKHNKLGWSLYLRDLTERGESIPSYAAPARATDYSNLPPTATFIGDLDGFRDETIQYVDNLKAAGVPVEFQIYPNCFHGFEIIAPSAQVSKQARQFMLDQFAHAVDNYTRKN